MSKAIIRKPAPAFTATAVMPDGQFEDVSLAQYSKAGKWVVLFFYPLDFTFVCPTEITQFSDRSDEFAKLNTQVLACSVDSKFSHLAWTQMPRKKGGLGEMKIPMVADLTKQVARDYGVLIDDETDGDNGVALRGIFLIDPKGNLRQSTVNDLPVGRDVDETLRLLQAFQYTEEFGDVVPCGWKPGQKTMKAGPKESQEYFNQVDEKAQ